MDLIDGAIWSNPENIGAFKDIIDPIDQLLEEDLDDETETEDAVTVEANEANEEADQEHTQDEQPIMEMEEHKMDV